MKPILADIDTARFAVINKENIVVAVTDHPDYGNYKWVEGGICFIEMRPGHNFVRREGPNYYYWVYLI